MAKQTVTELIDDLDGSEATQTIEFGFRGQELHDRPERLERVRLRRRARSLHRGRTEVRW